MSTIKQNKTTTYIDAGVNIDEGDQFINDIIPMVKKTNTLGADTSLKGFGAVYDLSELKYKKPVLISSTDGVGTKLEIAIKMKMHSTIGIDLVAMCVNDIITCGAKPLYFLDYISLNRISPKLDDIMVGIIKGCELAGIELIGGETAEHPMSFDIDLAGFATGIIEKSDIIDGSVIQEGDLIIGIESSGIHSNGYSLVNHLARQKKLKVTKEFLTPTHIYASLVEGLLNEVPILGMAHITGGGIQENLPRCLPKGLKADVNYDSWNLPPIFHDIMLAGEIPPEEMKRVFNLGIGYCLVIPEESEQDTHDTIDAFGYKSWTIGKVVL